ncbi:MAG TPA: SDR family NAD(P)-dependent oxidoreductase [Pseudonocardia sp.]|jgi:NAD(P)-dependent dehydrogenase (short-subunit alcohol dehydrogenase family)
MARLRDKVVVVTGAGRGIGRAYAEFLAAEGAMVVVNDNGADIDGLGATADTARAVAEAIVADGGRAVADTHDIVTDGPSVIQRALDEYGRVDGLVNNAGIVTMGGIDELSVEQIGRMIDVHLMGTVNTIRAAWPIMRDQGYGRIVNTSSASVFGVGGAPLYPTAKAAIIGLTRALASDGQAVGIKVNGVMPMGYSRMADTQAGLAEFMKTNFPPELIAPFVGALLVEDAPCSGEMFAVAGGRAARVFLSTVPGLTGFKTIDDVLANFDLVMDPAGQAAPNSMDEEIGFEYQNLGIDLSTLGINLAELGTAAR